MAEGARPALGLSIGATNLAAVTADLAIMRKPVLTLYRQRPPEVGVPSENSRLDEPGLVITNFVDRVGNSAGILATDGSAHRSEVLVADALRALAYAATGGRSLPDDVAVTYPAHWSSKAVDALGDALSRVSEWSDRAHPLLLIPDASATLFAVRANPGIPARGTVAVCDFGGSGTSITLMDAAGNYRALAPTVRHHDFCGDMIDQVVLAAVMDNMPSTGSFERSGASAIGSLGRLRAGCRGAKEELSSSTVTTLSDDLTGMRGDIPLTRKELDDAIRASLDNFVTVLDETLRRNKIRDLVAVVSVGGGANIPAVITTLSGHLRVPVITTPRPQLTAASGGALRATRDLADNSPTAFIPVAAQTAPASAMAWPASPQRATAATANVPPWSTTSTMSWSEAGGDSRVTRGGADETSPHLAANVGQPERPPAEPKHPDIPWYRRALPPVAIVGTAVALLLVGAAVGTEMRPEDKATTPTTSAPVSPPATQQAPPATQQSPPPSSTATNPPNPPATTDTTTTSAPPATPQGPVTDAPAPPPPPVPAAPAAAPETAPGPAFPWLRAIPSLPRIPGVNAPIPGLSGIPTLESLLAERGY
jgi:actin-like ATPase involved in cell morphogenesis